MIISATTATLFSILVQGKFYEKLGEEWWVALIPVYNLYVLYQRVWNDTAFLCMIVTFGGGFFSLFMLVTTGKTIFFLLLLVLFLASIALNLYVTHYVSLAFGQELAFTLGLIFIPIVFYAILAFDRSYRYIRNQS